MGNSVLFNYRALPRLKLMSEEDTNAANKKKDAAVEGITYKDLNWPGNVQERPTDQGPPDTSEQSKSETIKPKTESDDPLE